jgi:hypothetical protein
MEAPLVQFPSLSSGGWSAGRALHLPLPFLSQLVIMTGLSGGRHESRSGSDSGTEGGAGPLSLLLPVPGSPARNRSDPCLPSRLVTGKRGSQGTKGKHLSFSLLPAAVCGSYFCPHVPRPP